jgi:hypothetical protein
MLIVEVAISVDFQGELYFELTRGSKGISLVDLAFSERLFFGNDL